MNDELKTKLIESLDKVQEYVEATEEFVSEQAPLVIQEIVTLGRVESTWLVLWTAIICAVALVFSVTLIRRALSIFAGKTNPGGKYDGPDTPGEATMITGIISGVVATSFFLISICNISYMFEPWLAPRVYILHELSKLL